MSTNVVGEICLYGSDRCGHGWLAHVGPLTRATVLLGDGEPAPGVTLGGAVRAACKALAESGCPRGRVTVFAPGGKECGEVTLTRPRPGAVRWRKAGGYVIDAAELERVAAEQEAERARLDKAVKNGVVTEDEAARAIKAGDRVRSYDFRGDDQCYVEGTVEGFRHIDGCDRYLIRVDRKVWDGGPAESDMVGEVVTPPVNGTPILGGGVCNSVVKLCAVRRAEEQAEPKCQDCGHADHEGKLCPNMYCLCNHGGPPARTAPAKRAAETGPCQHCGHGHRPGDRCPNVYCLCDG